MSRTLQWPQIAQRLADSRSYWLHTTGPTGEPHAVPVWGAVVDDVLHLYSERSTVKARNLALDPRVAIHLPDPEDCLIVHGVLADLGRPADHADVVAALVAAYPDEQDAGYLPSGDDAFDVLWALRPTRAVSWLLSDWDDSHATWRAEVD